MAEKRDLLVFGSYNSKDRQKVAAIASDLESWGIKVWLDSQLTPGAVFGRALEEAIDHAKAAVVFVGAERGRWQELEIFTLLQNRVAGKLSVLIPVLLEGAGQNAGGFLSNIEHVDFRATNRDALRRLADALLAAPTSAVTTETTKAPESKALIRWIVQEASDPDEVQRIAQRCVQTSEWALALFACRRLRSIALDRRDAIGFAQSCETIGEIYFLSAKPQLANKQWAIGLAIYKKYGESKVAKYEERVEAIRQGSRTPLGSMQPASSQS